MATQFTTITEGSRAAQIMAADIYGGWVSGITASKTEGRSFTGITNLVEDLSQREQILNVVGVSKGTGENCPLVALFEGVDYEGSGGGEVLEVKLENSETGFKARTNYEATGGTGTGLVLQFVVDRSGTIVSVAAIVNPGTGYSIGDKVTFTNTAGGKATFSANFVVTDIEMGKITYTSYALKSIKVDLGEIEKIVGEEKDSRVDSGVRRYHLDEEITLYADQFGEDPGTFIPVICTVTDVSYVDNFTDDYGKPLTTVNTFQLMYDRYDQVHYVRIQHDDGTIQLFDMNGDVYTPTPIPN